MAIEAVTVSEAAGTEPGTSPVALQQLADSSLGRQWQLLLREREAARAEVAALAEVNQQLEDSVGIATHELKTPMASSHLAVALASRRLHNLLQQVATPDDVSNVELAGRLTALQELLTQAEESLERCTHLVVDLLDVSRIRTGRFDLCLAPCDLAAVVREAVKEQRQIAPARTIRLHLSASSAMPVVADVKRIRQVLTNYLTNALRYSPADRPVEVSVRAWQDCVRVAVRDEGPGLTPAEQRRIWERFHRVTRIGVVDEGTGAGLGLGLYLCKTIVEQHNGRLGVQSTVGRGSTFWFALAHAAVNRRRVERTGSP